MNKLPVIYENEDFIAINKAPGLLTIPDRFDDSQEPLSRILQRQFPRIFVVHRLDRDTSGLVLFAKNEGAHKYLSQLFENRSIIKHYQGIVLGSLPQPRGTIDAPIMEHPVKKGMMTTGKAGKPSVTEYEVVEDFGIYSLVQFNIHSGRTHQIRVHMKSIGHPVACDPLYGNGKPVMLSSFKKKFHLSEHELEERPLFNRVALHSYQLTFKDPSGTTHQLVAPLPKDFKALLNQLKKNRG